MQFYAVRGGIWSGDKDTHAGMKGMEKGERRESECEGRERESSFFLVQLDLRKQRKGERETLFFYSIWSSHFCLYAQACKKGKYENT